jgi:hypothetical protein
MEWLYLSKLMAKIGLPEKFIALVRKNNKIIMTSLFTLAKSVNIALNKMELAYHET